MHRLIFFKIALLVVIQHIVAVFGQRPKAVFPCPNDFLRIQKRCYYFSTEEETWQVAKMKCEDKNSTLAVLNTKNLKNAVREFLIKGYIDANLPHSSRLQMSVPRWLGGQYDWNAARWKWIYDAKVIRDYQLGEDLRRKHNLKWHCLLIDPRNDYSMNFDICFEKNYYICQTTLNVKHLSTPSNDSITSVHLSSNYLKNNSTEQHDSQPGYYIVDAGNSLPSKGKERKKRPKRKFLCPRNFVLVQRKCYHFSRSKETWTEAFYKCAELNSNLAILKNVHQDNKLRLKVNKFQLSNEPRWIGGQFDFKNKVWVWAATSEKLPIQPKDPSEFSCVLWDSNSNDRWTSAKCYTPMPYICQTAAKPADKSVIPRKKNRPSKINPRHS